MRILHVLDHSIPLQSGYTFRSASILRQQRILGWHTAHVTGLKQGARARPEETVDGLHFYRSAASGNPLFRLPGLGQWEVVHTLAWRIEEVAAIEKPDILHAHSPALNGLAALRAGHRLGLPVVYECRAFWEDAAVDHGTTAEGDPRDRLRRAMERAIVQDVMMPFARVGPGVGQCLRIDAGGRRAGDIADIVGAGAARA